MPKQRKAPQAHVRACLVLALTMLAAALAGLAWLTPFGVASSCPNEAIRAEQHSTSLPDCRAYEMVSPPAKNGGDVMADSQRTRAASDGSAIEFTSLSGFGDVLGTGYAAEYISERSTAAAATGWVTHAITPAQPPLPFTATALEPRYQGEFSTDLTNGVFQAFWPLTSDPNVAAVANLYVRHDLTTAGAGTYRLLTGCPLCEATSTPLPALTPEDAARLVPALVGASSDFTHVLFESQQRLTADATADPVGEVTNLYEEQAGTVRLAGILPDGTAASNSVAGQGASRHLIRPSNAMSADGSRIFFATDLRVGLCGSFNCGTLYMRTANGTPQAQTVQINASERTDCADQSPCTGAPEPDPAGPLPATYWTASKDGSRAFFTSQEALIDGDTSPGRDLYMYDANAPAGHHLTRLSVRQADPNLTRTPNAIGVLGASDDGHYVYFAATRQLVAGQPVFLNGLGIFVWHDEPGTPPGGALDFIGIAGPADVIDDFPTDWSQQRLQSRVTPDGRYLLFTSTTGENLLSVHGQPDYDQSHCDTNGGQGCRELYEYDAATKQLHCASCNPTGAPATTDALDAIKAFQGPSLTSWHLNRPLVDDGRVFFSTAEALVPQDTNGRTDTYEYDPAGSGSVHLISSGVDPSDSYFMDASASGDDAFFLTRSRFVGSDTDSNYDLYDARIAGGFSEPPPPLAPCAGDACQQGSVPAGPPGAGPFPSAAILASGNLAAPAPKPGSPPLSSAQQLRRALRACRKRHSAGRLRRRCESQARRRYAGKASKTGRSN
jgi:hypothetical protein